MLQWVVRLWSMNEINFNSIERVKEYLELESESKGGIDVPASWPSRAGCIEVENLEVRYAPELDTVCPTLSRFRHFANSNLSRY